MGSEYSIIHWIKLKKNSAQISAIQIFALGVRLVFIVYVFILFISCLVREKWFERFMTEKWSKNDRGGGGLRATS